MRSRAAAFALTLAVPGMSARAQVPEQPTSAQMAASDEPTDPQADLDAHEVGNEEQRGSTSSIADPFEEGEPAAPAHTTSLESTIPATDDERPPAFRLKPANHGQETRGLGRIISGSIMTAVGATMVITGTALLISHANEDPNGMFYGVSGVAGACLVASGAGVSIPGWVLLGKGLAQRRRARRVASGLVSPTVLAGRTSVVPGFAMAMHF